MVNQTTFLEFSKKTFQLFELTIFILSNNKSTEDGREITEKRENDISGKRNKKLIRVKRLTVSQKEKERNKRGKNIFLHK